MFGKMLHFSGLFARFRTLSGFAKEEIISSDLSHAASMIAANKCPECEKKMTLACVDGDKDADHSKRCSKCGVVYSFSGKVLVSDDGFYMPIRNHYLESLEYERKQAMELQRLRPHTFMARAVMDEVESIGRREELERISTYNADAYARKAA